MSECRLCPRMCGVDRSATAGFCHAPAGLRVSRASRHMYEEPCISGTRGSGTVFFSGCNMRCVFCQNAPISCGCLGEDITVARLCGIFLTLRDAGVHNINLVTPTHYTDLIREALLSVRGSLGIPVVWNSSGYELPETLASLRGLVDIYMPDFKYISPVLSEKYSGAADYAERAAECVSFMYGMLGDAVLDGDGLMKSGLLIRHLVLPGCRADSALVLRRIAAAVPVQGVLLGLMSQYTPDFYPGDERNLKRRVTTFEYEAVLAEAERLGFRGYMQSPMSATTAFTPPFTGSLRVDLD